MEQVEIFNIQNDGITLIDSGPRYKPQKWDMAKEHFDYIDVFQKIIDIRKD